MDTNAQADIIKKYSNFVGFPINVNGERINTIRALWLAAKDSVTEEEHKEFYNLIARAYDTPMYRLHYATDSPINIRGLVSYMLLYVGPVVNCPLVLLPISTHGEIWNGQT
jgi:HSP90 family molecular chaperone